MDLKGLYTTFENGQCKTTKEEELVAPGTL